jgi:hypothetical protein
MILFRSSGDGSLKNSLGVYGFHCFVEFVAAFPCIGSGHLELVGEAMRGNTVGEQPHRKPKLGTDGCLRTRKQIFLWLKKWDFLIS